MSIRIHWPTNVGPRFRVGKSVWLAAVAVVWVSAVAIGFWLVTDHELQPASAGQPPATWPSASQIPRSTATPSLVMFVHPRCPCSRASLAELARIMERCSKRVMAHVLFTTPERTDAAWTDTALWRIAGEIPDVTVHGDVGGREAQRFAAGASGHTLVYDRAGQLLFSGGITSARGHFGANPWSDRVISLLVQLPDSPTVESPVYGCPLCIDPQVCETTR